MTTVPQLRPFCCTDFSAHKKSENLSFLFGLSFTNKKKKSIYSNNYKDIGNLHLCCCTSSSHNSSNFSASSSSSNWDWNRWCRHFSEIEQAESFSSVLKFQLEVAIEKEDFQEAAKLKMAIAEATSKDSVAQIMSEMQNAIDKERYHDASRLCKHACSGLVGWWVGYSTESDDPFGRLVRITPGVGRFVGRSYSPRQLITASPGTPLFEIFVVKDEDEKYVMQVVCLQRAKAIATNSTDSSSESGKNLSSSDIEEASAVSDQNDNKEERSGQKGLNIEGSTEERIKSVINFLKDKIPSLNVKLVNANATMEVLEDNEILKQLMQDDEKVESSENSEDEHDELEDNQFNEVSLSGGADPVEDGEDLDMKLFIGAVVQDDEDMADKNEYVRLPAQINDMKRDSFVLHIPEKSLRYGSSEHRTSRIKVRAIATKGVSKLMPSDISKAFWSADIVSPKVSRDVREIVKLAVSQTQKQSHLSKNTNFSRITTSNNNFDPFDGLYVGAFGPYGTEVVQLRRRFGQWNETNDMSSDMEFVEYVEAVKLTGDLNVPAGQVTFRAKLGKGSCYPNREMYPDEFGVVASYKGQGRIAEFGFRNPEWVDGELLQLNGKGIGPYVNGADLGFLYVIPEQSFLVLFNRLRLPE